MAALTGLPHRRASSAFVLTTASEMQGDVGFLSRARAHMFGMTSWLGLKAGFLLRLAPVFAGSGSFDCATRFASESCCSAQADSESEPTPVPGIPALTCSI